MKDQLALYGVDKARCNITAWGKKVAQNEGWDTSPEYSRAELTFMLDGHAFPARRQACCDLTPPEDDGSEDSSEEAHTDSDDDFGNYGHPVHQLEQLLVQMQQADGSVEVPPHLQHLVPLLVQYAHQTGLAAVVQQGSDTDSEEEPEPPWP